MSNIGTIIKHKFGRNVFIDNNVGIQQEDDDTITISHWDEEAMGQKKPTTAQLTSWGKAMEAEQKANAYKEKRKAEYPPIEEQLDAIFKGGKDMEDMRAIIEGVKAKHPK